jgi:hypothetical protein
VGAERLGDRPIGVAKDFGVIAKPTIKGRSARRPRCDLLRHRQAFGVLFEAFHAEQLGADRRFALSKRILPVDVKTARLHVTTFRVGPKAECFDLATCGGPLLPGSGDAFGQGGIRSPMWANLGACGSRTAVTG